VLEFLKNHPHFELLDPKVVLRGDFPTKDGFTQFGSSQENSWWQLSPPLHETDGFFAAILQKKENPVLVSGWRGGR
jgi:16S rRNA (cytosine967-C5)-methyltransferase